MIKKLPFIELSNRNKYALQMIAYTGDKAQKQRA